MMPSTIVTNKLIKEIEQAFQSVGDYGSVEIYIQASRVTQITSRKIRKTMHPVYGKNRYLANK
ncbi:MAG: DUF2292 domain-containing protein [Candidatus Chisholmbacteria bacterium]|nr:DUF2292 domain-containing protein [Candidatus Chisholmbacteria bacterium]